MDAQEITFNQDPEAAATDIDQETDNGSNAGNCCCQIMCCPFKLCHWYIAPLTCQFCHTLKCFLFHPINFAMAIFLLCWDCTMLGTGVGIIPLCCMGIPLLWISMEFIIAFSRFDLGTHYYMVEDGKKLDGTKKHLLALSLYFTDFPLCCCYNRSHENCMNLMFERMKYLFTNIEVYKYVFYHILVKPLIAFSTCWIPIVVIVNVALVGIPIWYMVDDTYFAENKVIMGWNKDCSYSDDVDGIICPKDYVWIINTFSRALGVGVISLLILPLTMRLNNWFAFLNKIIAYRFYTFYYTEDIQQIQDSAPILTNQGNVVTFESV